MHVQKFTCASFLVIAGKADLMGALIFFHFLPYSFLHKYQLSNTYPGHSHIK